MIVRSKTANKFAQKLLLKKMFTLVLYSFMQNFTSVKKMDDWHIFEGYISSFKIRYRSCATRKCSICFLHCCVVPQENFEPEQSRDERLST